MRTTTILNCGQTADVNPAGHQDSPLGAVAGSVLRSARLSARLSQDQLATAVDVSETTIAAWEDGIDPLAEVEYSLAARVETALTAAGADPALVADLTIGAWCDLVLGVISESQDLWCLLADPIAGEAAFGELLAWAADGRRPFRYSSFASSGPLLHHEELRIAVRTLLRLGDVGGPGRRAA